MSSQLVVLTLPLFFHSLSLGMIPMAFKRKRKSWSNNLVKIQDPRNGSKREREREEAI